MRVASRGFLFVLAVSAVVALAAGTVFANDMSTGMKLPIGSKAPDFKLKDLNDPKGRTVSLSEYVGPAAKEKKVVMLEFWATWCDICKKEMPYLVRLDGAWRNKGVQILSIVLQSGSVDEVRKIIRDKKLSYPVLLDSDLAVATKAYGLAGPIPLKAIIDCKGIVRYAHVGDYPPGEDELPFVLEDLVKELRSCK